MKKCDGLVLLDLLINSQLDLNNRNCLTETGTAYLEGLQRAREIMKCAEITITKTLLKRQIIDGLKNVDAKVEDIALDVMLEPLEVTLESLGVIIKK